MTISQSFVKFLENQGYGIFGQDIYLYRVPNSKKTKTNLIWIIPSGGAPTSRNATGELIKTYQFLLYYRSVKAKNVDEVLSRLEEMLNCSNCVELEGYELVEMATTQFPADQDLDDENREVGLLQISLQVYKRC